MSGAEQMHTADASRARSVVAREPAPRPGVLVWAFAAPTLHRILLGEGALLAVNLSVLWCQSSAAATRLGTAVVSILTLGLMYAFNDLYDVEGDRHNPKKDQRLVAVYLQHQRLCYLLLFALKVATIALAVGMLGGRVAAAVLVVFLVNIFYSTCVKGVPIIDVVVAGLWGGAYFALVSDSPRLILLVTLMTAVCHLYQALGDKSADAQNNIRTTAVASPALAVPMFAVLSALVFVILQPLLGTAVAATAFIPAVLAVLLPAPHTAWLVSKVYYGGIWLVLLRLVTAS